MNTDEHRSVPLTRKSSANLEKGIHSRKTCHEFHEFTRILFAHSGVYHLNVLDSSPSSFCVIRGIREIRGKYFQFVHSVAAWKRFFSHTSLVLLSLGMFLQPGSASCQGSALGLFEAHGDIGAVGKPG